MFLRKTCSKTNRTFLSICVFPDYLASLVHIGTVLGEEAMNAAVSYTAGIDNGTIGILKKAVLDVLKQAKLQPESSQP